MTTDRLRDIVADTARLNTWANELSGLAFADERGWLGDADRAGFDALDARFKALSAELGDRWRDLPADAVAAHDAHVAAALDRVRAAGGVLHHFHLVDLEPRAQATTSPRREFDFWAIWAIHQL